MKKERVLFHPFLILLSLMLMVFVFSAIDSLLSYSKLTSAFPQCIYKAKNISKKDAPLYKANSQLVYKLFKKNAAKAKSVFLTGTFSEWKPKAIALKKNSAGIWEAIVALSPGKHSYIYEVDGKRQLSDFNTNTEIKDGMKVSVIIAK